MINRQKLHPVSEWEKKRPTSVYYQQIYFTDKSHEVKLVKGTIQIIRRVRSMGVPVNETVSRKAHWDGYGCCYVGTHNKRNRDYDIPFND